MKKTKTQAKSKSKSQKITEAPQQARARLNPDLSAKTGEIMHKWRNAVEVYIDVGKVLLEAKELADDGYFTKKDLRKDHPLGAENISHEDVLMWGAEIRPEALAEGLLGTPLSPLSRKPPEP